MEKKDCNIMLAFVSPIKKIFFDDPVSYPDIAGREYKGVQTNEAAIVKADRLFHLDHIFFVASEKVKEDMGYDSEFGRVTHLDYLKKRLCKENPDLIKRMSDIPYRDSQDMDKTLRGVTNISQIIMSYTKKHASENIVLSVDLTGGHRYTTMMMLAAMQLLQYEGVEIGHVFYTDFNKKDVFDVTSLERVFQLVSGAAEFVKFGSVESLQDYFGSSNKELSPSLIDLLSVMQEFSDAIKICRTGAIQPALQKLRTAIVDFRDNHGDGLEEALFASIIEVVEREYGALIGDEADEISIIRWCAAKGFFQQTMTLCTEWLPLYFIKHKIVYTDDKKIIELCKEQGKDERKKWQVFFITTYNHKKSNKGKSENSSKAMLSNIFMEFNEILLGNMDLKDSICKNYPRICDFINEYHNAGSDLNLFSKNLIDDQEFSARRPMLSKIAHTIYDAQKKASNYKKTYREFAHGYNKESLPKLCKNISNNVKKDLFNINLKDTNKVNKKREEYDYETLWKITSDRYNNLIEMGIYQSLYDKDTMMKCLYAYFDLRAERNQINHANAKTVKSAKEIEKIIQESLDIIENVAKR